MTRSLQLEAELMETAKWCEQMAADLLAVRGRPSDQVRKRMAEVVAKIQGRAVLLRVQVQTPPSSEPPPTKLSDLYEFAELVRVMMEAQRVYYAARARKEAGDRELGIAKQKEADVRRRIRDITQRATVTPSFPLMVEAEGRLS